MPQLELFRGSQHLEECPEDPPIYAFEHTYYTTWKIIEKFAGGTALESTVEFHPEPEEPISTNIEQLRSGEW